MPVLISILTMLALCLWAGLVATCATLTGSDAAGNGLSEVFAVFATLGLWALLAVILIVTGAKRGMKPRSVISAVILLPGSCAAVIAAIEILKKTGASHWPMVVPVLAPALLIAFAAWLALPSWRTAVSPRLADGLTWGLLLAISLAPLPATIQDMRQSRIATADRHVRMVAEVEHKPEDQRVKFERLGPDSPLWEWASSAERGSQFRGPALEAIRQLKSRQEDAEVMLDRGWSFPMLELPNLALRPTPSFCDRARTFLRRRAEALSDPQPPPYHVVAPRIEVYLPAMHWLVENHCDCGAELRTIEQAVRAYPDSPERHKFLQEIDQLLAGSLSEMTSRLRLNN